MSDEMKPDHFTKRNEDGTEKKKKTVTFSAYEEDWILLGEILAREGDGSTRGRNSLRSEKLREMIHNFNIRHRKGNPVIPLTNFMGTIKGPAHECFRCGAKDVPLWKVLYHSGAIFPTCRECIEYSKDHNTFKKVISLL